MLDLGFQLGTYRNTQRDALHYYIPKCTFRFSLRLVIKETSYPVANFYNGKQDFHKFESQKEDQKIKAFQAVSIFSPPKVLKSVGNTVRN